MENLIHFLKKIQNWLLFVLLEAASIALLIGHNNYQSSAWISSANAVNGKCYEIVSGIEAFFSLKTVNENLTKRNVLLEKQLCELNAAMEHSNIDTASIARLANLRYKVFPAKVVSNSVDKQNNLITIDKGSVDGIRKDMGVVSGTGVVGIVYLVGSHYSVIIPVLNHESSISCRIRKRGYFGYLRWDGNDAQYAFLEEIPRHAHYSKGDIVETSGYSSVFPAGLTVGKIVCSFNSADGLSYRAKVELSTDFGNLRDVCVIDNSLMEEQLEILNAARDSLAKTEE